jgi:hypothetical protein
LTNGKIKTTGDKSPTKVKAPDRERSSIKPTTGLKIMNIILTKVEMADKTVALFSVGIYSYIKETLLKSNLFRDMN